MINSPDTRIKVLKSNKHFIKANNIVCRACKDTTVHYNSIFIKSRIITRS